MVLTSVCPPWPPARLFTSPMDSTHVLISIIVSCHSNPSTTLGVSDPFYSRQRTWANTKWFASSLRLNSNTHRDLRAASVPALYTETSAQLSTLIIDFQTLFQSSFCSTGTLRSRLQYVCRILCSELGTDPANQLNCSLKYYLLQHARCRDIQRKSCFYVRNRTPEVLLSVNLAPASIETDWDDVCVFLQRPSQRDTALTPLTICFRRRWRGPRNSLR